MSDDTSRPLWIVKTTPSPMPWTESVEIPQRWTFALHSTDQCVQETVDVTICARRTRSFVDVSGYAVNPFTGELTCWGDVDACVAHHRRTLDESDRTA